MGKSLELTLTVAFIKQLAAALKESANNGKTYEERTKYLNLYQETCALLTADDDNERNEFHMSNGETVNN